MASRSANRQGPLPVLRYLCELSATLKLLRRPWCSAKLLCFHTSGGFESHPLRHSQLVRSRDLPCPTSPTVQGGLGHAVAAETEAQRCANFRHFGGTELCDSLSNAVLADGHHIVKIHRAVGFHAIVFREANFGRHTANRRRDRRHRNSGKIRNGAITGENQDGPFLVRRSEVVKPNVPSGYSAGHTASASQALASSWACRCLE